jgi:hypothetical protein
MIDKPGNYPLRSLASRTAARVLLDRIKTEKEKDIILVSVECIGHAEDNYTFKVYPMHQSRNR